MKPRRWQLRADSPFTLVAEGLRAAQVATIDGSTLVYAAPCAAPAQYLPNEFFSLSYAIRGVAGASFASTALPDSPVFVLGSPGAVHLLGHWPNDIWLDDERSGFEPNAPEHQFSHWDGSRWHSMGVQLGLRAAQPHAVFDWYDGASAMAQMVGSDSSVPFSVKPYLLVGKSSHPLPDFSTLPFPVNQHAEIQHPKITYGALPESSTFRTRSRPARSDGARGRVNRAVRSGRPGAGARAA